MARVEPIDVGAAAPAARALLEKQAAEQGRVTNMKRTLAHSPTALHAYAHWYDLHAEVIEFLGARATMVFAHAVSTQTNCLICSTFFRRWLIEAGEDPDRLALDDRERARVEYGRQLARDANGVPDDVFDKAALHLTAAQIVTLTAFAGLMVAMNLFNNALRVDLDPYLQPFKDVRP